MPVRTSEKAVYDCYVDGELVASGINDELIEKLGFRKNFTASNYLDMPYKGKYSFVRVGTRRVKKEFTLANPAHVYKTDEETLDYLYWHLRNTGVTCLTKDPTPYLPLLKEKGIEVKVRKAYNYNGHRRKSWYHVLEVV